MKASQLSTAGVTWAVLGALVGCGNSPITPGFVKNIQPSEIQTASIDGWGAGSSGNFINYLYNPFGVNKGKALILALQHGKTVSNRYLTHDDATGGEAWLVLHLSDGHLLKVEWAGLSSKSGVGPAKDTFWVSLDNQPGDYIEDSSGTVERIYKQMFQGEQNVANQDPTWLQTLSPQSVNMMLVDGNNNDTWFQDHSSPATTVTPSKVVSTLKSEPEIDGNTVDCSKISGPGSHWRTNSISLLLQLKNGSTIHVNGPYSTMPTTKGVAPTPVFKVTYANTDAMTAVFVKDTTGQLTKDWNQLGVNESLAR